MPSLMRRFLAGVLRRLPDAAVVGALRCRPSLVGLLDAGREIEWSGYLHDVRVRVDPADPVERCLVTGGSDTDLARALRAFVQPGDHCIDYGANVGAVTLHLAKLVGANGRVLAVEPGPRCGTRLRENLRLNPALAGRVSVAAGELQLRGAADTGSCAAVETLDALVRGLGWPRLDFVKIGGKGAELEVLRGGRAALAKFRPVVLFETMEHFREARALLHALGYRLCTLGADGEAHEVDGPQPPPNALAVPGGAAGARERWRRWSA